MGTMNKNYEQYNEAAELLKALAHPVRLCIVRGLIEQGHSNVTHMQECLELPQSTVSQHLQKLKLLGIVKAERYGLEVHYTIANDKAANLIRILTGEE